MQRPRVRRLALLGLLATLMTGCAQLSGLEKRIQGMAGDNESGSDENDNAVSQAAGSDAANVPSLDAILDALQKGKYGEGRQALSVYLERHPDDAVAQAVQHQLKADPSDVLGEESHRYVVRSGDSYSELAARHLGDAGLFLILARYNDSDNPSALRVGEVIRLPGPPSGDSASTPTNEDTAGAPARQSLEPAPRPSAETVEALALPDAPLPARRAEAEADTPSADTLQEEGLRLLEQGKREAALAHLEAALKRNPDLEPAASRVPRLRETLVADYHQRAIVNYRNQKLSAAIALWNRVLAIDPDFEPARSYRARARELQRRLSDL